MPDNVEKIVPFFVGGIVGLCTGVLVTVGAYKLMEGPQLATANVIDRRDGSSIMYLQQDVGNSVLVRGPASEEYVPLSTYLNSSHDNPYDRTIARAEIEKLVDEHFQ